MGDVLRLIKPRVLRLDIFQDKYNNICLFDANICLYDAKKVAKLIEIISYFEVWNQLKSSIRFDNVDGRSQTTIVIIYTERRK